METVVEFPELMLGDLTGDDRILLGDLATLLAGYGM
jgi:hypothetical protein